MFHPGEEYIDCIEEDLRTRAEGFVIDDDRKADWALRKIAWAEARKRRRGRFVQAETERVQRWQATQDAADERLIEFMQGLLRSYFDQLSAGGILGKKKSYRLPQGVLATKTHEITWRRDDAQLLAWAEPLGLVRTAKSPAWDAIKKRLAPVRDEAGSDAIDTTTGEVVPGVIVEQPTREVFQAKADLEGDRDGD